MIAPLVLRQAPNSKIKDAGLQGAGDAGKNIGQQTDQLNRGDIKWNTSRVIVNSNEDARKSVELSK